MWRISIILGAVGIGLLVYGCNEQRLSSKAKSEPQTITIKNLASTGPGDNAHVVVTDYILRLDDFVIETEGNNDTRWTKAYVPLVPIDIDINNPPRTFDVILKTDDHHTMGEMDRLQEAGQIKGLIINEISKLGGEEKKLLKSSYPGTNFDTCWIIEHGRKPAGTSFVMGSLGGGALLLLAGIGLLVFSFVGSGDESS